MSTVLSTTTKPKDLQRATGPYALPDFYVLGVLKKKHTLHAFHVCLPLLPQNIDKLLCTS